MSPHQRATTAPHYLPHPHSLCLFLSGILIKSADFDSHQLNAHKNTPSLTHTHTAHYHTFPQFHSSTECLFVFWLHSPCVPSDRGSFPTTTATVFLCVCVCMCTHTLANMDGCLCVCVKSWGVCLQCWEPHLHTLTCVQSLSSVQTDSALLAFLISSFEWILANQMLHLHSTWLLISKQENTVWKRSVGGKSLHVCQVGFVCISPSCLLLFQNP